MPEVRIEEVRRFMVGSLVAVGAPETEAKASADLLVKADLIGHFSHGLNKLKLYIDDIKNGVTSPRANPVILKESAATAWVDGCCALGATVGHFSMSVAIKKAKECGVGWVSARRCNHFGMAGYWALEAEKEGLIGMAFTNTAPIMVPTRSKQSAMGTNPISMAAPAGNGDYFLFDMATSAAAVGKIVDHLCKGESIPAGWALGRDGKMTSDPQVAFDAGRLLPLGGFEESSSYKGYGLSVMVEVLCSGLSGSNPAHKVPPWTHNQTQSPDLGQCFIAVDPERFAPGFGMRIAECLQHYRNLEPVDPALPVLAPGDKAKQNEEVTKERGTIIYSQQQIDLYAHVAKSIGVRPMEVHSA